MDVYSWFRRSLSRRQNSSISSNNNFNKDTKDEEQFYGITDQLIEFVKSFPLDNFKNFSFPDEEEGGSKGIRAGDGTSGNMRDDLSEWQEGHAMLILSKVEELSQLRFRLCPRSLKEQQFWRIYFTLVWSYVAEYELHAIRLAKLKQMSMENEFHSDFNACEVEMSEAKSATPIGSAASLEHNSDLKESSNC